ncbi:hypothetical protein RY831_12160 [Noviherbaspirillum sp. CPCC 100848]|uniref:Saccharopine dehydrogenase n=1 Tax=Noviherbaspirillum album TaxID=3080276 RepID=A0ABU6J8H6_9BURK|nr:hypothetical protein [Noviherbaspirillum sp. CPCC 100848]MEC4719906.1 hypothetical protein [Noviherbaspirillum sp. CPCC 100848]
MSTNKAPLLVVGGTGAVGSRAVKALRRLQPALPIAIGARNLQKASALAGESGNAQALAIDLERRDLGLSPQDGYSGVLVLLRDTTLNSMKFAQDRKLPYISFASFTPDVGPEVALFAQHPQASAVMLLGQYLGGVAAMATLHFAAEFRRVQAIAIGGLLDADDLGGPMAQEDIGRLENEGLRPLVRLDGDYVWLDPQQAQRSFIDIDGKPRTGMAYPLLDVVSLSAATGARSVRVDLAVREESAAQDGPSHQVVIEIEGELRSGATALRRYGMLDRNPYSALSAYGAALAAERMLGLSGSGPAAPGLHQPESLLDAAYVTQRLTSLGVELRTL